MDNKSFECLLEFQIKPVFVYKSLYIPRLKEVESFEKTGFNNYTLSLISGKYKLKVLYAIYRHKVIRFNQLQRYLNLVSHKTLSVLLKELEKDELIRRKEFPQIPPKVEYSLFRKSRIFYSNLKGFVSVGVKV